MAGSVSIAAKAASARSLKLRAVPLPQLKTPLTPALSCRNSIASTQSPIQTKSRICPPSG
jgi:hypothetical protein